MAERAGVSASTVGRIWRTFGLQPHVVESFKISDDPLFIGRCAKLSWELKRLQTLWFDDVA